MVKKCVVILCAILSVIVTSAGASDAVSPTVRAERTWKLLKQVAALSAPSPAAQVLKHLMDELREQYPESPGQRYGYKRALCLLYDRLCEIAAPLPGSPINIVPADRSASAGDVEVSILEADSKVFFDLAAFVADKNLELVWGATQQESLSAQQIRDRLVGSDLRALTALNLRDLGLTYFPPEINRYCRNIEHLDVSGNNLSVITVADLSRLAHINVENNQSLRRVHGLPKDGSYTYRASKKTERHERITAAIDTEPGADFMSAEANYLGCTIL